MYEFDYGVIWWGYLYSSDCDYMVDDTLRIS